MNTIPTPYKARSEDIAGFDLYGERLDDPRFRVCWGQYA